MSSRTTLVVGATAALREAAICVRLAEADHAGPSAVILEGLASGRDPFDNLATRAAVQVVRIAPGCLCCSGKLSMRVTLNRVLRTTPATLYISLADSRHLAQIKAFLSAPDYNTWLSLGPVLDCDAPAESA